MDVHPPRRRIRLAIPVLWVSALLVVCCTATAIAAAAPSASQSKKPRSTLAGTWSGRYGGAFSGTFTLHWKQKGTRLTGTIALSNPGGKYRITGSVHGRKITFGAVAAGATYTGAVAGKSMAGSYKVPNGGGTWSARKTS